MARPVIKPLKMADGVYVRTNLEELREHFDLPSVLGYYADGRLKEWLENRYYKNEAEQLSQLDPNANDFNMRLCELLGVVCPDDVDVNVDEIAARNAKLAQLKQFTDKDDIIQNVDKVAFNQDEMINLLNGDAGLIYLCGESFAVSPDKGNIVFIGVNSPVVNIGNANEADLSARKITFRDVVLDGSHIKKIVEDFDNDFDDPITKYLIKEFEKLEKIDLSQDKVAMQRLREASKEAKRNLSNMATTNINLPFITMSQDGPKHLDIMLTRTKFDILIHESISNTSKITLSKEELLVKIRHLRLYTNSDEIIRNIGKVAFTQDEMIKMLNKHEKLIYLCGKSFKVPENIKNVTIIGINNPVVHIGNANKDYLSSKKIVFRDVTFSGSHLNKGGVSQ